MSLVIPKKLANYGKSPVGVASYRDVRVERISLLPSSANANQMYTPDGVNQINFRIPAYSGGFMDTARSFLSYNFQVTGAVNVDAANQLKKSDVPAGWIKRITIKSSSGLVLEQIDNYNILCKIMKLMSSSEAARIDAGDFSSVSELADRVTIGGLQTQSPRTYTLRFDTGLLSQHLKSYIPLHVMDQGFALDVSLQLAPIMDVLEYASSDPTTLGGLLPSGSYQISDVKFNIGLVKIDSSLCDKFDKIACGDESIVMPFTTFHNHTASCTSMSSVVHISDNCTDLRRVYSVFTPTTGGGGINDDPSLFMGSVEEAVGSALTSYNYKLGNESVFNEPVQETTNNNISLAHFLDAHHSGGNKNSPAMSISNINNDLLNTRFATVYESKSSFVICCDMTYSAESKDGAVTQGVSPGSQPITGHFKFSGVPSLNNHNFVECGYDLVVKNGSLSYVEHQLHGKHSV